jgi:hypothetical protein
MSIESVGKKPIKDKILYTYGVLEQKVLNSLQELLILREEASVRKSFRDGRASTAILYGYPIYHGNVQIESSVPRENMPHFLNSLAKMNRRLDISTLALSGFITEQKENGEYINLNPISEAEAAKDYYVPNPGFEMLDYSVESVEGESKFVRQLHNSLIQIRRIGERNIVVHARIQDILRVRLVLKELHKLGKIPNDINAKVISHPWELDQGDTTGSLAFSLIKLLKLDFPTIRRLPDC